MKISVRCALIAIVFLIHAVQSRADQRDFPFTYSWVQAGDGEHELAYHGHYARNQSLWQHEFELEYGISSRLSIAPYVTFEQSSGQGLRYDSFKLETRYQLG